MDNTATVKRVSLDFKWEIGRAWEGYVNPWPGPMMCMECDATGFNTETKKLFDTFDKWSKKLTKAEQEEFLDVYSEKDLKLLLAGRFSRTNPSYGDIRITLTEIRANRKNLLGYCETCQGNGEVANDNPAVVQLYRGVNLYLEWEPIEPPHGPGWQLWSDGEFGSPASPVFKTAEELAKWCSEKIKPTEAEWLQWILRENKENPSTPEPESEELTLPSEWLRVFVKPKSLSD